MGCKTCASTNTEGKPAGCRSGGCDRMSTLDWIQSLGIEELDPQYLVELSHKNGARKSFAKVKPGIIISTGDMVIVDPGAGTNIAKISLSGPLAGLQLKKKNVDESHITQTVIRKAGPSDIERLGQARKLENKALIKAREIARTLGLEMKIGDVEYQGDLRKATFYYTADGRVDFRELVRHYAQEFRIKVEMRQIGARQESARIGGLGSCGRELCCSTWLTDFKTVSTAAARNQNIALNQSKLSGQCGRLKCCLNYELDMYVDALKRFPKKADTILSKDSKAFLIKIDIFNNKMFYNVKQKSGRPIPIEISPSRVKEILDMNKKGEFPPFFVKPEEDKVTDEIDFEVMKDPEPSKKKKSNKRKNQRRWKKKKQAAKKTSIEKSSNPKPANKKIQAKKSQTKNSQAKNPGNKKS